MPPPDILLNPGGKVATAFLAVYARGADTSIVSFDTYVPVTNDPTSCNTSRRYLRRRPTVCISSMCWVTLFLSSSRFRPSPTLAPSSLILSLHFINITAGDGGNALVGSGGVGGFLGSKLRQTVDLVGDLSITLPANIAYEGTVNFVPGFGGNGFASGGDGGSITGTSVRYVADRWIAAHLGVNLYAGDGGFGVGGKGETVATWRRIRSRRGFFSRLEMAAAAA